MFDFFLLYATILDRHIHEEPEMNLDEAIEFISQEAIYYDEQTSKFLASSDEDAKSSPHYQKKIQFTALYNLLVDIQTRLVPDKSTSTVLPSELEGLPKELLEQLSTDTLEINLLKIMEDHGGPISLDRLILGYYKLHNEILERRKLTAKLYRMCKSGSLYTVGERGIYSLYEPEKTD